MPTSTSKLIYNTALNKNIGDDSTIVPDFGPGFTDPLLSDPFFTKVNFNGAFGLDNWTIGWTNFDPNNADYSTALTGISNSTNTIKASIYPNPAHNELNVTVSLNANSDVRISLIDLTGKLVSFTVNNYSSGLNTINLNTTNIVGGMYFVEIETNEGIATQKIEIK